MADDSSKARRELPVALTIAGSDSSAGAGLQADLKTFAAHRAYGICAVTSVVAEIPGKVTAFDPVDPSLLIDQLRTLDAGFSIAAIKTGMLATSQIVAAVADFLEPRTSIPVVVDPVMVATSGARLLTESAVALYRERLLPLAAAATPNFAEAEALLNRPVSTIADMSAAAGELLDRFGCRAVVIKGGHLPETDDAVDILRTVSGEAEELRSTRIPDRDIHGTGCTFSAAMAARLARGDDLIAAARAAKAYISAAIGQSHRWTSAGREIRALNHFPVGVTSPKP